jgi:hypothetical protein
VLDLNNFADLFGSVEITKLVVKIHKKYPPLQKKKISCPPYFLCRGKEKSTHRNKIE